MKSQIIWSNLKLQLETSGDQALLIPCPSEVFSAYVYDWSCTYRGKHQLPSGKHLRFFLEAVLYLYTSYDITTVSTYRGRCRRQERFRFDFLRIDYIGTSMSLHQRLARAAIKIYIIINSLQTNRQAYDLTDQRRDRLQCPNWIG